MHWLSKVKKNIVCHVNHVIDWTDTSIHKKVLQPLWTWLNSNILNHTTSISSHFITFDGYWNLIRSWFAVFSNRFFWEVNRFSIDCSDFMCHTTHRKSIRTVRCDWQFDDFIIKVKIWENAIARNGIFWQNLDTIRKFLRNNAIWKSKLCQRTDHPERFHAANLTFFDFVIVCNTGTRNGNNYLDASSDIWSTTNNLTWTFSISCIYLTQVQVCFRHIFTWQDMTNNQFWQALSRCLNTFHFNTCRRHFFSEFSSGNIHINQLF